MKISYSALKSFEQCPLQWKYNYIDHLPRKDSIHLFFGNQVHEALDFLLKERGQIKPLETAKKFFTDIWEFGRFKEINDDEFVARAHNILTKFHEQFDPKAQDVLETEKFFYAPLESHQITGLIDRLDRLPDGSLEIIDYKTGKVQSQQDIASNLQLTFYYHAIRTMFGDQNQIKLSLHFLETGQIFSSTRTPEAVQGLAHEINTVSSEIEAGSFGPKLNRLCPWCDFSESCQAYQNAIKDPVLSNRYGFKKWAKKSQPASGVGNPRSGNVQSGPIEPSIDLNQPLNQAQLF